MHAASSGGGGAAAGTSYTNGAGPGLGISSSSSSSSRRHITLDLEEAVRGLNYCDLAKRSPSHSPSSASASVSSNRALNGALNGALPGGSPSPQHSSSSSNGAVPASSASLASASTGSSMGSRMDSTTAVPAAAKPQSMTMADAFAFLKQSPQIRCLAVMALAQGITTNLLELAWKHYLHRLATTPAAYAAFLGDTAMWTGVVTGAWALANGMSAHGPHIRLCGLLPSLPPKRSGRCQTPAGCGGSCCRAARRRTQACTDLAADHNLLPGCPLNLLQAH